MATLRDYVILIDHLVELTQTGQISWAREIPPRQILTTHNRIQQVYVTFYNGRNIRLYEEMYKYFTDEDEYYWQAQLVLEFVDENSNSIWQFPQTSNGWDLLNAVKYRDANVDAFINDIFGRKP
jgi:hypothetical protein